MAGEELAPASRRGYFDATGWVLVDPQQHIDRHCGLLCAVRIGRVAGAEQDAALDTRQA